MAVPDSVRARGIAMQEGMEHRLINLFRQMDQSLKRVIGKRVEGTGLYRSQHRLLMILGRHPDLSQTLIAEKMDISPAAVAVTLKKLEKGGYIVRQSHAEDNRMNHVEMTPKGQEAIDKSIICFREIEGEVFRDFSQEEMELLESFLVRIIENEERYYQSFAPERAVRSNAMCNMQRRKRKGECGDPFEKGESSQTERI